MQQNFLIYTNSDGTTKLQVNFEDENICLNKEQMGFCIENQKRP